MPAKVVSIITRRTWIARADTRDETHMLGTLQDAAGENVDCLVENMSLGGARVCAEERLVVGESLRLSIPEFAFTGPVRVIWETSEAAGLAFPRNRPER